MAPSDMLPSLRNGFLQPSLPHLWPRRRGLRLESLAMLFFHAARRVAPRWLQQQSGQGASLLQRVQHRHFRASSVALKRDYYEVLGVPRTASKQEIKRAYLGLAKKHHPDTSSNPDSEKFVEAGEAYEVLSDDDRRARYDRFGHGAEEFGGGGGGGQAYGDPFEAFREAFGQQRGGFRAGGFGGRGGHDEFEDILNDFFGGGGPSSRRRGPQRGPDVQLELSLSFMEAARGVQGKEFEYFDVLKDGRRGQKKKVATDIPAGVDSGMHVKLSGQGGQGDSGAPRGDLYLQIVVKPDPYFRRDEADIHVDVDVTFAQAALGATIDVLTIDGMVDLKIPRGTQASTKLRMRGKGLPHVNRGGGRGHQVCHINVIVPTQLTERQEQILRELDQGNDSDESARCAFERLAEFFTGTGDKKKKGYGS